MPSAWINGQFIEESAATVSLRDTGLLHGAGVFTTMRSYGGRVFRLPGHLRRLRDSCEALFIPLQFTDDDLSNAVNELIQRNDLSDARLRLTVTRGTAQQDPLHGMHLQPTAFITAAALEPYPTEMYERGMTVILMDEQKLNPYDLLAGHKTLDYFSRLSGLREAVRRGAGEALWFDVHNFLQSSSISNVFVAKNGALVTPPTNAELRDPQVAAASRAPKSAVLPGVTRDSVIKLARANGIDVKLASIDVNQLLDAEEVFLTNSIMQVMPVCRIEKKPIGDEKPGRVTRQLSQAYQQGVAKELM